jgi:hypothetical protein
MAKHKKLDIASFSHVCSVLFNWHFLNSCIWKKDLFEDYLEKGKDNTKLLKLLGGISQEASLQSEMVKNKTIHCRLKRGLVRKKVSIAERLHNV